MWQEAFKAYNTEFDKILDGIDPTKLSKTKVAFIVQALDTFTDWCRKQIFLLSQEKIIVLADIDTLKTRIEDNRELIALIKELASL